MKVKEIISYHLYEDRGLLDIEFTLEDYPEKINYLEIPEEDLEHNGELYEAKEWVDWETNDSIDIRGEINESVLYESLEYYLNNSDVVLNE